MNNQATQEIAVTTQSGAENPAHKARPGLTPAPDPGQAVERLFNRLMPRRVTRSAAWNWPRRGKRWAQQIRVPQVDVIDRDSELLMRIEVPGVARKDIDISVSAATLRINCGISRALAEERKGYSRFEIPHGSFLRSLALPQGINASQISAHLRNGVLEIVLPKNESIKRHSVEVK